MKKPITTFAVGLSLAVSSIVACSARETSSPDDSEDSTAITQRATTFRNPVRGGVADPWMFQHDGYYYVTYTAVDRIILARAKSVTGLAGAEAVTVWQDSTPGRGKNIWAPEFHFLNGHWYVYYTADGEGSVHQMFVLESQGSDPMGPYSFKAQLATQNDFSIDGTVLKMPDQKLYFVWSGHWNSPQSLFIASMSNPWTLDSAPVLLSSPTAGWERHGNGGEHPVNEGPEALYSGNRTFLVFSASGCETPDYALGMLEYKGGNALDPRSWSKTPWPVFARSDANWVFGPGHNSFFTSPDGKEIWNAYHAVTSSDGTPYGSCGGDRSLRLDKMNFDANGSPIFGVASATWMDVKLPSGDRGR